MTILKVLIVGAAVVSIGVASKPAGAQGVRRYQPATPTISPYLNLTRFRGGGLPNYFALVRPLNQQREFNEREVAIRQRYGRTIDALEREVQNRNQTGVQTGSGSWFMTPGERTAFLDSSPFYQTQVLQPVLRPGARR